MIQEKNFKHALREFGRGMNLILESVINYGNEEEQEVIEKIFNGGNLEGYAQNRYRRTFSRSFDEEVSLLNMFLEEHLNERLLIEIPNKNENIKNLLDGFYVAKSSLDKLVPITKFNETLKNELMDFETEIYKYNPFKEYSIVEFRKRFKGWSRAFHKELKDELGRRALQKYKLGLKNTQ